jgi:hypothetical protein
LSALLVADEHRRNLCSKTLRYGSCRGSRARWASRLGRPTRGGVREDGERPGRASEIDAPEPTPRPIQDGSGVFLSAR